MNNFKYKVYDLRIEYLKNPIGIDVPKPLFSWKIKIENLSEYNFENFENKDKNSINQAVNLVQTAYRILVASNITKLENDEADIWDSEKFYSSKNFAVEYNGLELKSNKKYFWKVKVWLKNSKNNDKEFESDWSEIQYFVNGLFNQKEFVGKWIGPKIPIKRKIEHILNLYTNTPATYIRKSFEVNRKIVRAMLFCTALGIYRAYLNGKLISDRYFPPEWTDYRKKVLYQVYEVTNFINQGNNIIGIILADGWYSGRLGLFVNRFYGAGRLFKAFLVIEFENSENIIIQTDNTWKYTECGPIRGADFFDGEDYDSRMEIENSNSQSTNIKWFNVKEFHSLKLNKLKIVAQKNEPVQKITEIVIEDSNNINEIEPGKYIINLGQNIAGFIKIRITPEICEKDSKIIIRYAEVLDENGYLYVKNLRTAKATDRIIYDGRSLLEYEPIFTFHGFQYIEITGLKPNIKPEKFIRDKIIIGIAISSDTEIVSKIETSHPKLNKLLKNIYWTARNNQISIPTDCPQRDERMGWMGDAHIFCQTAMYYFNMASFYRKWIDDIRDSQLKRGQFTDVVPHVPRLMVKFLYSSPAWADCGVNLPLYHYINYGDIRVLKNHYNSAKKFVDLIHKKNPNLIWTKSSGRNYGDWLNGDTVKFEGYPNKGGAIPKEVFATLFFGKMSENLGKIAKILELDNDANYYSDLATKIKLNFTKNFIDENGIINGDTQSGYALALDFGFIPENMIEKIKNNLIKSIERYNYRLSTGFLGTLSLMNQLIELNREDLAFNLLFCEEFPSWFYMINNGATTIWERWDSFVPKRGMQSASMTSFDHYAFGSIGEWIYKNILGINHFKEDIGFQNSIIQPTFSEKLDYVEGYFNPICGDYKIFWKKLEPAENENQKYKYLLTCTIPINAKSQIILPYYSNMENSIKINNKEMKNLMDILDYEIITTSRGKMIKINIGSGLYEVKF